MATAPAALEAEAEAALPDAVEDPDDAAPDVAADPLALDDPDPAPVPFRGEGVGLPSARVKLAQARRVRLLE